MERLTQIKTCNFSPPFVCHITMCERKPQINRLSAHKYPYLAFHGRRRRTKNLSLRQDILRASAPVRSVAFGDFALRMTMPGVFGQSLTIILISP